MERIKLYDVLSLTQRYISKYYASALTDESKREDLKNYIEKYILDNGYMVDGMTDEQLNTLHRLPPFPQSPAFGCQRLCLL